tara:strand:- start:20 stop:799 length:780 start_codon:yes stop_codon:yes gene_type:complete
MIDFEKWHGNGNDFVIINSVEKNIKLTKSFIKKISDRNKGIGFDQLIVVGLPTKDDHDFFVRFYNSDSSEAGMCLNGIRCASSYIWKNSLAPIKQISFKTKHNNIKCYPENNSDVSSVISKPKEIESPLLKKELNKVIKGDFFLLNIGNNHLGICMESIEKFDLNNLYLELEELIKKLEINLSIFSMKDNSVRIRTFENGVGETLSCGSASLCVASYFLSKHNKLKVKSIGGELKFKNHRDGILMSGPTKYIYKGNINE